MRHDDTRITTFLAFVNDLKVDKRLCALDRGFLTHYSALLVAAESTNKDKDQKVLRILRSFFTKIKY